MRTLILAAAAAFALSGEAAAQRPCGPHAEIVKGLALQFGEHRVAGGLTNSDTMLEIFAAPSGSWTAVMVGELLSCIVASGENWRQERLPRVREQDG
jgi:hypothetical protein